MAQKLSNLPVGAKVKDNLSKYNGKPIILEDCRQKSQWLPFKFGNFNY